MILKNEMNIMINTTIEIDDLKGGIITDGDLCDSVVETILVVEIPDGKRYVLSGEMIIQEVPYEHNKKER